MRAWIIYVVFLISFVNFCRFGSKIPKILRDIYEGLGQQIPFEVQSPSQKNCDADDSFEVINDSVAFSDYGSNNASNQR